MIHPIIKYEVECDRCENSIVVEACTQLKLKTKIEQLGWVFWDKDGRTICINCVNETKEN